MKSKAGASEFLGALQMRARDQGFTAVQLRVGAPGEPTTLACGYAGDVYAARVLRIDEARLGTGSQAARREYFASLLRELGQVTAAEAEVPAAEELTWLEGDGLEDLARKFLRAHRIAKEAERLRELLFAKMQQRGRLAVEVQGQGAIMIVPGYQRPELDRGRALEMVKTMSAKLVALGQETDAIDALPIRMAPIGAALRVTLADP